MQQLLSLCRSTLNLDKPLKISKVTPEGGKEKPGALTVELRPVGDLSSTGLETRKAYREAVAARTVKLWYGDKYEENSFLLDMAMAMSPLGRPLNYLDALAGSSGKFGAENGYFTQAPQKIREKVWENIADLAEKSNTEERARKAATSGGNGTDGDGNGTGGDGNGTGGNGTSGGTQGASSANPQLAAMADMGIFAPLPAEAGSAPSEETPRQEAERAVETWRNAVVSICLCRLRFFQAPSLKHCCRLNRK